MGLRLRLPGFESCLCHLPAVYLGSFYLFIYVFMYLFIYLLLFRAALAAYGSSQARGLIGAVATSLHHSHSNVGSKRSLQPTPQLMALPNP